MAERQRRGLHFLIELDGGINETIGAQCMAAGADELVAGSTVFDAEDIAAVCRKLTAI